MYSYIYCLQLVAKKHCRITEETLKNEDPFEEVLKKMIIWIKNIVHRANKFRNFGSMPKKYFPGIIEHKVVI